jgi:hypothetical protein
VQHRPHTQQHENDIQTNKRPSNRSAILVYDNGRMGSSPTLFSASSLRYKTKGTFYYPTANEPLIGRPVIYLPIMTDRKKCEKSMKITEIMATLSSRDVFIRNLNIQMSFLYF